MNLSLLQGGFRPGEAVDILRRPVTLRRALETRKRKGTVLRKSTKHGPAVCLPPKLGREIYEQLKTYYPFLPKPPGRLVSPSPPQDKRGDAPVACRPPIRAGTVGDRT